MVQPHVVCRAMLGKMSAYIKKDMDEFINVSNIFISRYIATFSSLKKRTKSCFIF